MTRALFSPHSWKTQGKAKAQVPTWSAQPGYLQISQYASPSALIMPQVRSAPRESVTSLPSSFPVPPSVFKNACLAWSNEGSVIFHHALFGCRLQKCLCWCFLHFQSSGSFSTFLLPSYFPHWTFFYYKVRGAITTSNASSVCHCWNCVRKHL